MRVTLIALPILMSLFFAGCQVKSTATGSETIVNHQPVNSKWTITSPTSDEYIGGEDLTWSFMGSEILTVTGSPRVGVTVGSTLRYLTYLDGSGTKTLRFRMTVQSGDLDTNGVVLKSPIDLNGGTITQASGSAAALTFTVPNNGGVHVDGDAPVILSTSVSPAGYYIANQQLNFFVTASEAVYVTGTPDISVNIGGNTKLATYVSGSGTNILTFRYTIVAGEEDTDGITLDSIAINIAGSIRDRSGQDIDPALDGTLPLPDLSLHLVDSIVPEITAITLPADNTYLATENMDFTVTFSEAVTITNTPRYALTLTSGSVFANYLSGSTTDTIIFRHTVQAGETDDDGIDVATTLNLNTTGTIRDVAGNNAVLTLTPPSSTGILVDAVIPVVTLTAPVTINLANVSSYSLSGTCTENGQDVVVAIGSLTVSPAPVCTALAWSATNIDVTSVADALSVTIKVNHADAGGNNALEVQGNVLKDTVAPTIITTASVNADYEEGEVIPLTLTWNENVTRSGAILVPLTLTSGSDNFSYVSGSGTTSFTFHYTVANGDSDTDGMDAGPDLDLNGGTLKDAAGNDADLTLSTTAFPSVRIIPPVYLAFADPASWDFGSVALGGTAEKTFLIDHTGAVAATTVGGSFTNPDFTFKGGSFPGTGGTCSTSVSSDCTIVVQYAPTTAAVDNGVLSLNWDGGTAITKNLTGTGVSLSPTKLKITSGPSAVIINTCIPFTISSVTDSNVAANVATSKTVSLVVNNGTGTFYSDSGCSTSTASTTITSGTSSKTIYFQSGTAGQSLTLIFNTTGLTNTSYNVTTSNAPTKIISTAAAEIETNTCAPLEVALADASGIKTGAATSKTINITHSTSAVFYTDSFCTQVITSISFAAYTGIKDIYVKNSTQESASITFTDAGAMLTSSSLSTDFVTNLTWWNNSWLKRKQITLNNQDQASSFTDMPVLVRLNTSRISYSDFMTNGEDIRFTLDDHTTVLSYEIERWNSSGESLIWVKIPSIAASSNKVIYMYYDNTAASDAQNASTLWSGYSGVWNMKKTGSNYLDSTGSGKTATPSGTVTDIDGPSGKAVSFNGSSYINTGYDLSQIIGRTSTLSFWLRTTQTGNNTNWQAPGVTGVEKAGDGNDIFFGYILANGSLAVSSGDAPAASSNFVVNDDNWRYVSLSRDETTGIVKFYVNGVLNNSASSATGWKTTAFTNFGMIDDTGGSPEYLNGALDGLRLRNSVESDARLKAEYKFLVETHLTYGPLENL